MVLLLIGPPSCGKGTQARLISGFLHCPSISTGDMLRDEMQAGTRLGKAAQSIMANGGLVNDEIVNQLLAARIDRPNCSNGFLLDGYPRTLEQAQFLDKLLKSKRLPPAIVVHLDVHDEVLVSRMAARRQCPECHRIYNLKHQPPKINGLCDDDGIALIARKDDQEEVFRERLATYAAATRPVLDHYRDHVYYRIDAEHRPEQVFNEISTLLERQVACTV